MEDFYKESPKNKRWNSHFSSFNHTGGITICNFGFLGPGKRSMKPVRCWTASVPWETAKPNAPRFANLLTLQDWGENGVLRKAQERNPPLFENTYFFPNRVANSWSWLRSFCLNWNWWLLRYWTPSPEQWKRESDWVAWRIWRGTLMRVSCLRRKFMCHKGSWEVVFSDGFGQRVWVLMSSQVKGGHNCQGAKDAWIGW